MSNHLKKPMFWSLGQMVKGRITDAEELRGKALPCVVESVSGAIVTVNFEIDTDLTLPKVTIPVAMFSYIRVPIQPGDKGLAIPADIPIAGISGLGGGLTKFLPPSNLGALLFLPVSSKNWDATDPDSLVLTDATGASKIELASDGITLSFGAHSIIIDSTSVTIDGHPFLLHLHSGVTTGGGSSGPVVP